MKQQAGKILVTGSIAYDHVMRYDKPFSNVLLPDMLKNLSVTFTTSSQSVHYGGTGANIAYTLKLFGVEPMLIGVAGRDFARYEKWLARNKIDTSGILINEDFFTASAYILTDLEGRQITIFQIGAMGSAPQAFSLRAINVANGSSSGNSVVYAIIAPDDPRRMIGFARECRRKKIPYIFDPAQQIDNLAVADLKEAISGAEILVVNEYEAELLCKKMGIFLRELAGTSRNYIETMSEKGCSGFVGRREFKVAAVAPKKLVDPTGCGDAFRAGVLVGIVFGFSLEKACRAGVLAATYNLENAGTQAHHFTMAEFKLRFERSFGEKF